MRIHRHTFQLLVFFGTTTLAWILCSRLVVPSLVKDAYHGRSFEFLNRLIEGQDETGVGRYVERWHEVSHRNLGIYLSIGAFLIVVTMTPAYRRLQETRAEDDSGTAAVSGFRRALVGTFLAVILLGHLASLVLRDEYWPFSRYPMYAGTMGETYTWRRLYGVTDDGEIRLRVSRYFAPFDEPRLSKAILLLQKEDVETSDFRAGVRACLRRYETLRERGRHDGPRLRGLRLYELEWTLDPWAENADDPDRRNLICEVIEEFP